MPDFQQTELHTERLTLRWLDAGDAAAQFAIFSDPDVMRFINEPWTSMEKAEQTIAQLIAHYHDGSGLTFGVVLRDSGQLIGNVNLHRFFDMNRRCEIGYALASRYQKRGYATEALEALVGYAFGTLDQNRIEADIDPRNTASARVLERLGFCKEGYMRERWIVDGQKQDSAFYGLLRSDWAAKTQSTN